MLMNICQNRKPAVSQIFMNHICALPWRNEIWAIFVAMNTTELVVEMRPEKNSGPYGIWTSHISSHCSPLGRFIWIQHYNQLPVGSLAHLVERCNRHRRGHGFMGWKDICQLLVVALGNWKLGNVWPKSISVLWNVWIEAQVFLD